MEVADLKEIVLGGHVSGRAPQALRQGVRHSAQRDVSGRRFPGGSYCLECCRAAGAATCASITYWVTVNGINAFILIKPPTLK